MSTPQIRAHLDDVLEGIKDSQALRDFKEEVAANLNEKITDYVTDGFSSPDAFYKAISSLGDIRAAYTGQQQIGHKYIDSPRRIITWFVIMAVIALFIVSLYF